MHAGMKKFMDKVLTKYQYNEHETWAGICARMANVTDRKFYPWFSKKIIVPQGGILFGLGRPGAHPEWHGNLVTPPEKVSISVSNCVVQSVREDSMASIMEAASRQAKCYQHRMGVGCDLSILRPRGSLVRNAASSSSGAASFMNLFSTTCGTVCQEGRRGALMLTIDISHPDVEEFIEMKMNAGVVTNANISVKIFDDFMEAVIADQPYDLRWGGKVYKTISARYLWDKIIKCAYKSAEPGILFWDRVLERPHGFYEGSRPITTNPCSEIPLPDDDVCLLTSIYLPAFVRNPYQPDATFDFDMFKMAVGHSIEFIDLVKDWDIQLAPTPEIAQQGFNWRRVGVGTHGLSDMFWRLGLTYGSEESISFVDILYQSLMHNSYRKSVDLAKEKGAFPKFNKHNELRCNWLTERLPVDLANEMFDYGRRNLQLNTIAPTGSVSVLSSNCSSGIEPPFDLSYDRFCLGNIYKDIPHGEWLAFQKITGETKPREHMLVSSEIGPKERVAVQAAATNWLDHSCSSTVNFLKGTTEKDVEAVYMDAYKSKCEGITVYVDGSREGIVSLQGQKRERPTLLAGNTHKFGQDDWVKYITVTKDERGMPIEVFACSLNKSIEDIDETKGVIAKLAWLANKKGVLSKFGKYQNLSMSERLTIHTTILLRCSINISEILSCFDGVIAGTLPFFVKLSIKNNIPENMQEVGQEVDPTCLKGNCG